MPVASATASPPEEPPGVPDSLPSSGRTPCGWKRYRPGATPGANTAGQGGVQIAFTTKSGTNKVQGNGYYYLRQPSFNTNYYFNTVAGLPKNLVTVKQMGVTIGGPIVIPGILDGHNKAFFFVNYEEFRQPTAASRTRVVASPAARAGFFHTPAVRQAA